MRMKNLLSNAMKKGVVPFTLLRKRKGGSIYEEKWKWKTYSRRCNEERSGFFHVFTEKKRREYLRGPRERQKVLCTFTSETQREAKRERERERERGRVRVCICTKRDKERGHPLLYYEKKVIEFLYTPSSPNRLFLFLFLSLLATQTFWHQRNEAHSRFSCQKQCVCVSLSNICT